MLRGAKNVKGAAESTKEVETCLRSVKVCYRCHRSGKLRVLKEVEACLRQGPLAFSDFFRIWSAVFEHEILLVQTYKKARLFHFLRNKPMYLNVVSDNHSKHNFCWKVFNFSPFWRAFLTFVFRMCHFRK